MKSILAFICALALISFSTPAFALDPHDAQVSHVSAQSVTSTTTAYSGTITSLTTVAVNSGTNSYLIFATVDYEAPSGGAVTLQLTNDGTAIAGASRVVSNSGSVTLMTEVEGIAASKVIALKALIAPSGATIKISKASLVINGQAGATQ